MSTNLNTLPTILIEQILNLFEYSEQAKLQYCNKRISWLLKRAVFEEMLLSEYYIYFSNRESQVGKYVKRFQSKIDETFFEVADQLTKLEHIEVRGGPNYDVFNRLHLLDRKLKSLTLTMYEPFPTQFQFNFNHIIDTLEYLNITLWNEDAKSFDVIKMFQIPNLKALKLTVNYFPEETFVIINRSFPKLKTLELFLEEYNLNVIFEPTTFLNLKRLEICSMVPDCYRRLLFQSFPQLKYLKYSDLKDVAESDRNLRKKVFNQLLGVSMTLQQFSQDDVLNFQNVKKVNLYLLKGFDSKSMQNLLSLPKLSQLTLPHDLSKNFFQNVTCKSPLRSLTLVHCRALSQQFLKFLKFNIPSLTNLSIQSGYGKSAFEKDAFSELDGKSNLNLLFLTVYKEEDKFAKWIKAQCPYLFITYYESDEI